MRATRSVTWDFMVLGVPEHGDALTAQFFAHLFQTAGADYPGNGSEVKSKLGGATAAFRNSQIRACITQRLWIDFHTAAARTPAANSGWERGALFT